MRCNFYSLYRCHNYHFKIYGAMFLGQFRPALAAAEEMSATLPEELLTLTSPPMADWLEGFVSMKQHVLIRFGKWNAIGAEELPENRNLFCVTTAMMRYAKAIAHAVTGDVDAAEREAAGFDAALTRVPESRYVFNNRCLDILAIAGEMMRGEIEYRRGRFDTAFGHLRAAVELDDNLPYDEPWGWMQPTRHALAALLLEQARVDEAGRGVSSGPRVRRYAEPRLPAPGQRLEPARLSRVPPAARVDSGGGGREAAAGPHSGPHRRPDHRILLLPARHPVASLGTANAGRQCIR